MNTKTFNDLRDYSDTTISKLRQGLKNEISDDVLVVTAGSFARREASPHLDLDFFVVTKNGRKNDKLLAKISDVARKIVPKPPAAGGAFDQLVSRNSLLDNIGGNDDSNQNITRRMLYLLEGEWLTNEREFKSIRTDIIKKYVKNIDDDRQIALFLLNDIIRYWRTITVDYTAKTTGPNPKPWATRNIKLVFARKLLYASGLFAVALTADRTQSDKQKILIKMFEMPAFDRIAFVCGEQSAQRLKELYDVFLKKMADADMRSHLENLEWKDKKDDAKFRYLKNESHYFGRELMGLFESSFHSSHPIRTTVIF